MQLGAGWNLMVTESLCGSFNHAVAASLPAQVGFNCLEQIRADCEEEQKVCW